MEIISIVNRDLVNLVNCESEPIHIPGSIQPHGFLLALDEQTKIIRFCSENVEHFIQLSSSKILGQKISAFFSADDAERFTEYISQPAIDHSSPFVFSSGEIKYNVSVHRSREYLILEAEPVADTALSVPNFYVQTNRFLAHMEGAGYLLDLCKNIAHETRSLTGFDRVMIYRFDENYNGEVIAESKREDLISFANQKYPHTDIPVQARELYIRNQMRMIVDVNYTPVPLLTMDDRKKTNQSLDLSNSSLRSVSPIHIEYLQNMGVGATLTISLLLNKKLWGLIACHHYSPKSLPHYTRLTALMQGHFLTSQIAVREAAEELEMSRKCENSLNQLLPLLNREDDFIPLHYHSPSVLKLTNATGAVFFYEEKIFMTGKTPAEKDCIALVKMISEKYRRETYTTSSLVTDFQDAAPFSKEAAGLIYFPLSLRNSNCVIWLREEIVETVKWAGNPYSHLKNEENLSRLTPRKSFDLWVEEVSGKSLAWRKSELNTAENFAYAMEKNLGLRDALLQELRYKKLNAELEEANKELANINWISTHDLKEPIRKIQIFASMVLEKEQEHLTPGVKDSVMRMRSAAARMQALIEDILSYSKTGSVEAVFEIADLNVILKEAIADISDEKDRIGAQINADQLPPLKVIPFQVKQLFVNLLTNSIKFTEKEKAVINIKSETITAPPVPEGREPSAEKYYHISLSDNGIGFEQQYAEKIFDVFQRLNSHKIYEGTGIGLAICKKIMANHKGFINAESAPGKGTTMHLYFPAE